MQIRRALIALATIAGMLGVATADTLEDREAERLFEEGRKLKDAGKPEEACKSFEKALTFNRNAVGTLLNVALCRANAGKVASAAKLFADARDRATEQELAEHRKAAQTELDKLERRVPHVTITFAEKPSPETRLVVDDEIVPIPPSGKIENLPIDPGERTIVVTAPGRMQREVRVTIVEGKSHDALIPKLELPIVVKHTRKTAGKIATFSGIGLFAASVGLAFYGRSVYKEQFSNGHCQFPDAEEPACDVIGLTKTRDAKNLELGATITGGVGLVAIGVGVYLWMFGPRDAEKLAIVPVVDDSHAGFAAIGRF